jgi:hypothetical protein
MVSFRSRRDGPDAVIGAWDTIPGAVSQSLSVLRQRRNSNTSQQIEFQGLGREFPSLIRDETQSDSPGEDEWHETYP